MKEYFKIIQEKFCHELYKIKMLFLQYLNYTENYLGDLNEWMLGTIFSYFPIIK